MCRTGDRRKRAKLCHARALHHRHDIRVDAVSPGALGLVTLGLAPTKSAIVNSTASLTFLMSEQASSAARLKLLCAMTRRSTPGCRKTRSASTDGVSSSEALLKLCERAGAVGADSPSARRAQRTPPQAVHSGARPHGGTQKRLRCPPKGVSADLPCPTRLLPEQELILPI